MIKKNIATLTLPLTNNYGGILQAFALQETLLELGHTTMLINIKSPTHSNFKKRLEHMKQRIRKVIKNTTVFQPDFTSESDKKLGYMYFIICLSIVSRDCYVTHQDWVAFIN